MRARNIKPAFFKNEDLAELDHAARLLFIGLWCMADKNGLIEYRPKRIKAEIFPYDDGIDIHRYITELSGYGFVVALEGNGKDWILVNHFVEHQNPHHTEKTKLPNPKSLKVKGECEITVISPLNNGDNPADSLIPDSLIPDSCIGATAESNDSPTAKKAKKGTRLQIKDLPDEWETFCRETRPDLHPHSVFAAFHDYWVSVAGQKGVKLDWLATWRNWVRNQRSMNNGSHQQDTRSRAQRVSDELDRIAREDIEKNGYTGTLG